MYYPLHGVTFIRGGATFIFPHRGRFITSADADGNHMFPLATGPRKVTQILLPSSQVENGLVQNNKVHLSDSAVV